MYSRPFRPVFIGAAVALTCASLTLAHIRIAPTESAPGAREKYTMRVPNEKQTATIRSKANSPRVWTSTTSSSNPAGKSTSRRTTRARLSEPRGPERSCRTSLLEFGMLGINPKEETSLVWKFIQYYEDGSKEEFTGPVGSRLPSPVTTLKKPEPTVSASK